MNKFIADHYRLSVGLGAVAGAFAAVCLCAVLSCVVTSCAKAPVPAAPVAADAVTLPVDATAPTGDQ